MRVLVAPLNWGLGHATRCIPLVSRLLADGNEVVLGGDGMSLRRLRQAFPALKAIKLAPLNLCYSSGKSQVWALLRTLPQIVKASIADHRVLRFIVQQENIDMVISDNRFGCFTKGVRCIYMTHQLFVRLPKGWRWAEGLAYRLHRQVWKRYDEVWIPDYEDVSMSLSGALSHRTGRLPSEKIRYIGPLSRFALSDKSEASCNQNSSHQQNPLHQNPHYEPNTHYDVVALLSGLEPQRTLLEHTVRQRYECSSEQVLIVRGKIGEPQVEWHRGNLTMVPQMTDEQLVPLLKGAQKIICRSGYSTVMDLSALNVLDKAEWIPTPGQPEQEYLAQYLSNHSP